MTTKKQIRGLFEAVVERHPDLTIIKAEYGDKIVLRPINHLIRGFYILRSAYADYPDHFWSIGYTFYPRGSSQGGVCGTQFVTPNIKEIYWSHPRHQDAVIEVFEAEILPVLRSVDTIGKMLSLRHPMEVRWNDLLASPLHKLRLHAALGDFRTAAEAILEMKANGPHYLPAWSEESFRESIEQLWPLIEAEDRAGTAALLHRWEEEFIIRNGLESIYERTPFPLEEEPGSA